MAQSTSRSADGQAGAVRSQFAQHTGLPFVDLLSATEVESACRACSHRGRKRIYTPWITLAMFLSQILSSSRKGHASQRDRSPAA